MAATVHLSPGVYTNEVDFSHYTSRVGDININVVGKTPQGPAGTNTKGVKLFGNITDIQNVYGTVNLDYPTLLACKETAPWCSDFGISRVLGTSGHNKTAIRAWPIYMTASTAPYGNAGNVVGLLKSRLSSDTTTSMVSNLTMTGGASGTFNVTFTGGDAAVCAYTVSVSESSPVYMPTMFGTSPTDSVNSYIFVDRIFPDQAALISGADGTLLWYTGITDAPVGTADFNDLSDGYQAARTPWFVSDASAGAVSKLFRLIMRYDGESSNTLVKAMIENINTTTKTFDVVLRSFSDTDANMVVVERFKKCSFDATSTSYILRRIGDGDTYDMQSDYVYVELWDNVSSKAVPSGVYGVPKMNYSGWIQSPMVTTVKLCRNRGEAGIRGGITRTLIKGSWNICHQEILQLMLILKRDSTSTLLHQLLVSVPPHQD